MSIECLNRALKIQGLNPTQKLILVILANYADENNTCYPSYKHLSKMIGLSTVKSVQQAIKHFTEIGYIVVEHRKNENGGYTSNRYHLKLPSAINYPSTTEDTTLVSKSTNNTKEDTKIIYSDNFEKFWSLYPRKIGKHQANKLFLKIDESLIYKVIKATEIFVRNNLTTDIKYIPHPTTFLNQRRYEDYFNIEINNKSLNKLAG